MRIKKSKLFLIILIIAAISGGYYLVKEKKKKSLVEVTKEINPALGSIKTIISCTATVLPKNRLEIKPPVNGRMESILVNEGDIVGAGAILGWMSSTERAALLDAARGQGEETLAYWKETYKAIPLISPIDGEVIVATTQPGQAITTSDAVIVLSDQLIVRAQVDETDIGKIRTGQKAVVTLDAYPATKINAEVEHIYYESETVNNVTIYKVDLVPEKVPGFFRSGMNALVGFVEQSRDNAMLIPQEAVARDGRENYVLVKQGNGREPVKVRVELGISDEKNVEVLSGVTQKDTIILKTKKYSLPKESQGTNPFMPWRSRKK